ncbi:MAG: cytidylate kinase-like family protein [Capsulimonadaceae bacterium]|nr:cytidylate kinase-like family protein [Capsulimonadaceae bacterium]
MEHQTPFVISISRQKGCGGAYLGQKLAQALGIMYLDSNLVAEIANKLDAPVTFVEEHDERVLSIWESIIESLSWSNPWLYNPPPVRSQALQVSQLTTETIVKIAAEKSVVVVGRGGSYLLRSHPRHISIFLYANKQARVRRIQEVYEMSHQEAVKLVEKTDVERERYNKSLSGLEMHDATQYNLALDTSVIGLDCAQDLIMQYVHARFPDVG